MSAFRTRLIALGQQAGLRVYCTESPKEFATLYTVKNFKLTIVERFDTAREALLWLVEKVKK